jgi:hypothetical protein
MLGILSINTFLKGKVVAHYKKTTSSNKLTPEKLKVGHGEYIGTLRFQVEHINP